MENYYRDIIKRIQSCLNFEGIPSHQFRSNKGLGKVGVGGFILGVLFGISVTTLLLCSIFVAILDHPWRILYSLIHWNIYASSLFGFHFLEFLCTALYQPCNLSYDSYVINHSSMYTVAALASCGEFWIETFLCGSCKRHFVCISLGLLLVIGGQIVRTVAMSTCGENFSHLIMEDRTAAGAGRPHKLVTTGIYKYFRHPSYFGWFYWSIGTQVLLCNPLCFVLYTYASWTFFNERIPYEEHVLLTCYEEEYATYIRSTIIGIPFVRSIELKKSPPPVATRTSVSTSAETVTKKQRSEDMGEGNVTCESKKVS